ncbi:hypothetical protein I7I48_08420 [Histoplasma ohiense]|nr:hypothetical protein I7I48_08420 [Histoplasma ohiense (nom. inval.)]
MACPWISLQEIAYALTISIILINKSTIQRQWNPWPKEPLMESCYRNVSSRPVVTSSTLLRRKRYVGLVKLD